MQGAFRYNAMLLLPKVYLLNEAMAWSSRQARSDYFLNFFFDKILMFEPFADQTNELQARILNGILVS